MTATTRAHLALAGDQGRSPADSEGPAAARFVRPTPLRTFQAHAGRWLLRQISGKLFRFNLEVRGLEYVPSGEPVIVAAGPHRGWLDSFLIIMALPATPRLYYLGSAEAMFNTWWKRHILAVMGGVVPVSTVGQLNRDGLETSLAILDGGNSLGVFPEGWGNLHHADTEIRPLKRGVAFLSQRSGRRVLPVGLAGTQELWRGKTVALEIGPPLPALAPGAGRTDQQAYVDRLADAIRAVTPVLPPVPADAPRPWRWLTKIMG